MSSGQTPRTPRYFPRMKVRGARRKRMAPFQRTAGAFDSLAVVTEEAAKALNKFVGIWNKKENN